MPDCKTSTKHFIYVNEYIFDQCTLTSIYCCEILLSWVLFFCSLFFIFLWCNFSEIIREQCWRTIRIFTEFCSFGQKVAVYLDKIEPLSVSVKNIQYLLIFFVHHSLASVFVFFAVCAFYSIGSILFGNISVSWFITMKPIHRISNNFTKLSTPNFKITVYSHHKKSSTRTANIWSLFMDTCYSSVIVCWIKNQFNQNIHQHGI